MAAPMPKSVSSLEKNRLLLGVYRLRIAYLSPLGWPCIYSRSSTSWIMTRIRSHWVGFFLIISIGFGNGFRKNSLFGIIFLPY